MIKEINVKLSTTLKTNGFYKITLLRFYSWFIGIDRALEKIGKTIDVRIKTDCTFD